MQLRKKNTTWVQHSIWLWFLWLLGSILGPEFIFDCKLGLNVFLSTCFTDVGFLSRLLLTPCPAEFDIFRILLTVVSHALPLLHKAYASTMTADADIAYEKASLSLGKRTKSYLAKSYAKPFRACEKPTPPRQKPTVTAKIAPHPRFCRESDIIALFHHAKCLRQHSRPSWSKALLGTRQTTHCDQS